MIATSSDAFRSLASQVKRHPITWREPFISPYSAVPLDMISHFLRAVFHALPPGGVVLLRDYGGAVQVVSIKTRVEGAPGFRT